MPEEKRRYSLISVDAASEDEPTVRVDAQGVHAVSGGAADDAGKREATSSAAGQGAARPQVAERDAQDELDADDLDGSVPFAGMQRVIVALLILVLVAGIAYFVMM